MGKEPAGPGLTAAESAYYRAVEDHFARLRGTVFVITPKDYALLRRWWREGVPLAAVLAGVAEIFERKRGEGIDPVSSLTYCRHAVNRHAKRLAPGGGGRSTPPMDVPGALTRLALAIGRAAEVWAGQPALAAILHDLREAVETMPTAADPVAADEALSRLELAALECAGARLPAMARADLEARIATELDSLRVEGSARLRTERALRLRLVRELLGLPRLELAAGGQR